MLSQIITLISQTLHLTPQATRIGLLCLLTQLLLTLLFDKRTSPLKVGPWSNLPAFTAHQLVAFPSMIILSYYGWKEWEYDIISSYNDKNMSSYDRLFSVVPSNKELDGDVLLAYGTGAILLWDIPIGMFAPSLQDTIMFFHHVGMFAVAAVMSGMFCVGGETIRIGWYYVPFYFGVIETSSVFLSVVDQFHPKRKEWYDWLYSGSEENRGLVKKLILGCNEVCRMGFAISFIVLRGLYFPYTSFFHCIPDIWRAYYGEESGKVPEGVPMWTGYFLIVALVLFSCLQSYWGVLVGRQVKKALFGDGDAKEKKKKVQ